MGIVQFYPDQLVDGGGLWSNRIATMTNCRFESKWSAGGKRSIASPALVCDLVFDDDDSVEEQGFSLGKDYQASEDGKVAAESGEYALGGKAANSSNVGYFVKSLRAAMPETGLQEIMDKLWQDPKASNYNGLKANWIRETIEREGLQKKQRPGGGEYEFQALVVDSVIEWPWEAGKGAKAAAATKTAKAAKPVAKPAAAAAPAATATTDGIDAIARTRVMEALIKGGGQMDRAKMSQEVYKLEKDVKLKPQLVALVYEKAWITANSEAGGFTLDEKTDVVAIA
jgi:hypothetical protein